MYCLFSNIILYAFFLEEYLCYSAKTCNPNFVPMLFNYKAPDLEPTDDTIPLIIDGMNLMSVTQDISEPVVVLTKNTYYGLYLVQNHILELNKDIKILNIIWLEAGNSLETINDLKMLLWQLKFDIIMKSNNEIQMMFMEYFQSIPTIVVFNNAKPDNSIIHNIVKLRTWKFCYFKIIIMSSEDGWDDGYFIINLETVFDQTKAFNRLYDMHWEKLHDIIENKYKSLEETDY